MSTVSKKVLAYVKKEIKSANDVLEDCEAKRKDSFAFWMEGNFKSMVSAEAKRDLWTSIKNNIFDKNDVAKMSDFAIKKFLLRCRNFRIQDVIQSVNKNSTNSISVEIQILQEDVQKKFVGISCIDTGSLAKLLFDAFQENVIGQGVDL